MIVRRSATRTKPGEKLGRDEIIGRERGSCDLAKVIARQLEEDIVLGRRHPRERLVEQDLCERFDTHRGDVRMAFFELEKKGIIKRIPKRGAVVRDLTPKEVMEIYAVREELEVMAVRILPFPVAAHNLDRLDELQSKHSAAIDRGDMLGMFYENLRFHQVLYGLCGNTVPCRDDRALRAKGLCHSSLCQRVPRDARSCEPRPC